MNEQKRILARSLARELTEEEMDRIAAGLACTATYCNDPGGGGKFYDDSRE